MVIQYKPVNVITVNVIIWLMLSDSQSPGQLIIALQRKLCLVLRRKEKKIISQFCQIQKDCDQNGDRMSKKDKKLP